MKKTTKKLQLTRLTVKQLGDAAGGMYTRRVGSYDAGCSGSCNSCGAEPAESNCPCTVILSYAVPR
jgi:hypothetical protein